MNRSLLLIVCDFLLLSLLALAEFERTGQTRTESTQAMVQAEEEADLADPLLMQLMEAALMAEQDSQEDMEARLEEERRERERLQQTLDSREQSLAQERRALEEAQRQAEELARAREEAQVRLSALETEKEQLSTERQQLETAVRELEGTVAQREESQQMTAAEMERLQAQLAENRRQLQEAEKARQESELVSREMITRLEAANRERDLLNSNLQVARDTIDVERQEREVLRRQTDSLTAGVTRLAEASNDIQEEVRGLRPLTANEIFNRVRNQSLTIEFTGQRRSLFGSGQIESKIETVFTKIDGRTYLWVHLGQTPFATEQSRSFIESLNAQLRVGESVYRIPQFGILQADRRLLFIPVPEEVLANVEREAFPATKNPFRFDELVVIDPTQNRFGETSFRIEAGTNDFLSVDRRAFSALFGEFSPQRGNLAFTKTGEFLGIVVRSGEAWKAGPVRSAGTLGMGDNFSLDEIKALPEL